MAQLFGRDRQIAELGAAQSSVVLISGDQGTGKSQLLVVMQQQAANSVIAPEPVSVALHPAGLQVALLDSLGAAVALIAEDATTAKLVADRLLDATRRLALTRLKDIRRAVGQFLLDSIRRRLGPTIADLIEDYASELKTSEEERLSARITSAADLDVIEVFVELAAEVSEIHGGRIVVLALDNLERLTDDDLRRLAHLVERLPHGVRVLGTFATSTTDAIERLDVVRSAGCDMIRLEGLAETAVRDWLATEELDPDRSAQLMRLTAGYPMYVEDALPLIRSGGNLNRLSAKDVLKIATEAAWRQLSLPDQRAASLLSPFADPLTIEDAAGYLGLDPSAWALLEQRLVEARIFVVAGERRWFHELRRKHIRLEVLSPSMRALAAEKARDLIDARISAGEMTAPLLIQRVALMADMPEVVEADESLAHVMRAELDDIAVAAAMLELSEELAESPPPDPQMVLWHARDSFAASPRVLDALYRLADAGLVGLASDEEVAVVIPAWSREAALAIAGRAAGELGRSPVPSIATALFDHLLRPRIGAFDGAYYGVGTPPIADLAAKVAQSSSGKWRRRTRPAVLFRARHGAVATYAAVMYSEDQARDDAIRALSNADDEVFGQKLEVFDVVSNPLVAVPSDRFSIAADRLLNRSRFWSYAAQAPDAVHPLTLREHTEARAETMTLIRGRCNSQERRALRLEEEIGYLFSGDHSSYFIAQVYGLIGARSIDLDQSWRMSQPFSRFHLSEVGGLSSGQRLGRLSASRGHSAPKDPALSAILELRELARGYNRRAERREVLLNESWLVAEISNANEQAARDAEALTAVIEPENGFDVGRRLFIAVFVNQAKPGWIRGPNHATALATIPCSAESCSVNVRVFPRGEAFVDYRADPEMFARLFGLSDEHRGNLHVSDGDAQALLSRLLGFRDDDVRVMEPTEA